MCMSKVDQVARSSVGSARTVSERPWVRVPVGPRCFSSTCDIWLLSVCSRLGPQASKSARLVVPPLFRADSGTNLIKQEEMSKDNHMAR